MSVEKIKTLHTLSWRGRSFTKDCPKRYRCATTRWRAPLYCPACWKPLPPTGRCLFLSNSLRYLTWCWRMKRKVTVCIEWLGKSIIISNFQDVYLCGSVALAFTLHLIKVLWFSPISVLPTLSLPVSTNQMWARGTAGACLPFTTTRTRALRWFTACWTGPCSFWRWSLDGGTATTSRQQMVRTVDCSSRGKVTGSYLRAGKIPSDAL